MAILDKGLEFSDAQAVTASAASTNVIDCGVANPNTGRVNALHLQVACNTTADSSGDAATVTIKLEDSADDSSFAVIAQSTAIAQATCVAGTILWTIQIPPTHRRYLRLTYTIGTENLTAGKFDAFLTTVPNK